MDTFPDALCHTCAQVFPKTFTYSCLVSVEVISCVKNYQVNLKSFCLTFGYAVQTLEMLEKKESVLLKKATAEVERAKEFTRAKNKRGMIS